MRPLIASVLVMLAAHDAAAQVQTLTFPIPSDLGQFGNFIAFDYFVQPPPSGRIVESRLILDFDSQGGVRPFHDAADLFVSMQLGTGNVPFWRVFGSELGWSGSGRFTTTLVTHAFDGEVLIDTGPYVLWFTQIQSADNDQRALGGRLTASRWEFDYAPVPAPGTGCIALLALACAARRRVR